MSLKECDGLSIHRNRILASIRCKGPSNGCPNGHISLRTGPGQAETIRSGTVRIRPDFDVGVAFGHSASVAMNQPRSDENSANQGSVAKRDTHNGPPKRHYIVRTRFTMEEVL
uniref:Uncharacterized protein n=1 Tax=Ascaris lumbricoides TaxID=6252 RepID=A0A0M3HSG4_ASCLU